MPWSIPEDGDNEIELGSNDKIVLSKVYGPAAFDDLRITPVTKHEAWIIEQYGGPDGEETWKEVARIPAQCPDNEFKNRPVTKEDMEGGYGSSDES